MENVLFLQSESDDPFTFYARMREDRPVCFDEANAIWAVYRYADCKHILEAGTAHIPGQDVAALQSMNKTAQAVTAGLARLANPPRHEGTRKAVMDLFEQMRPIDTAALLSQLLLPQGEVDWVDAVCKKLPALAVMESLGFAPEDSAAILPQAAALTKLMLPNKAAQHIEEIHGALNVVYPLAERHVMRIFAGITDEARALYAANLVGLLIQSVDAGRGILSNALLQGMRFGTGDDASRDNWERIVVETLRFDPPIHNTRRVLTEEIDVGGVRLPKGAPILVVLASANRDVSAFSDANCFNPGRANNHVQLGFGAGAHHCPAARFSTRLAVDALMAMATRRPVLHEASLQYEAMVNARLPRRLRVTYSS